MKSASDDAFLSPRAHLRPADPRASSTQSLVPSEADAESFTHDARRRLLLIYIHGFYGNKQSFRSFPAHVHAYLKDALADSHVIHTKIYPRYKTYHAVKVGAENFSQWLAPHEDDETDVVLVGHSMGGILAAEVVLMPNPDPFHPHLYKHRILGIISMDTPFIGLHPRIIPTGIASLFRRDDTSSQQDRRHSQSTSAPTPENQSLSQTASAPGLQEQGISLTPSAPASQGQNLSQPASASDLSHEKRSSILDCKRAPGPSLSPDAQPSSAPSPNLATSTSAEPASRPRTPSSPPPPYPHPRPEASDPTFDPPFHNDIVLRDRSRLTSLAHFAQKHFSEGIVSAAGRHVLSHMEYAACLADYSELKARYADVRALEDVDPLKGLEEWGADTANGPSFRARAARVRFVNYYTAATGRPKKEKKKNKKKDGTGDGAGVNAPAISIEGSSAASITSHDSQAPSAQAASFDGSSSAGVTSYGSGPSAARPDSSVQRPTASSAASSGRKEALHSAYDHALKTSRRKLLKTGLKLLEKRSSSSSSYSDLPSSSLYFSSHSSTTEQSRPPQSTSTDPMPARMRKFCATPKVGNGVDDTWVAVPMRDIDEVDAHVSMFVDDREHYGGLVLDVADRVVRWVKEDELRRVAELAVQ